MGARLEGVIIDDLTVQTSICPGCIIQVGLLKPQVNVLRLRKTFSKQTS